MPDYSDTQPSILASVTEIVAAHLANNIVAADAVPAFIRSIHETISALEGRDGAGPAAGAAPLVPAVPIEDSVHEEYIVCLEDGKRLRMLKRYLMSQYGLTPEAYRAKWNLPRSYPMVAPAVSQQRRASARVTGLGKAAPVAGKGSKKPRRT